MKSINEIRVEHELEPEAVPWADAGEKFSIAVYDEWAFAPRRHEIPWWILFFGMMWGIIIGLWLVLFFM